MKYIWFRLNFSATLLGLVIFFVGVLVAPLSMVKVAPVLFAVLDATSINWIVAMACGQSPSCHEPLFRIRRPREVGAMISIMMLFLYVKQIRRSKCSQR